MSDLVVHRKINVTAKARSGRLLDSPAIVSPSQTNNDSSGNTEVLRTGIIEGEGINVARANNDYTISHADTSDYEPSPLSGDFDIIDTVEVDKFGHITGTISKDLKPKLDENYLSKINDDTAQGLINFIKGWTTDIFSEGTSGAALYKDDQGNWHIQAEYVHVLRKFTAEEVEIQKTSHIGGKLMQTAASMICINVEDVGASYRCFMRIIDTEGNKIYNQFKVGDQALVETFNLTQQADGHIGNHFLWRLVTAVGENYIDLSKTIAASDSDMPQISDHIVQLGYQGNDDLERQNAQILAGAGSGSPYFKQYTGINTFSLPVEDTRLKPGDNLFAGVLNIKPGSTGGQNIEGLVSGSVNLLRNSGFTGDYENIELTPSTELKSDTKLYSQYYIK